MKIYIDFDGTLFDTDKYTEDFMKVLSDHGINKKLVDEAKENLHSKNKLFNIDFVVDYFIDNYNIDESLRYKISNLLDDSYIYSDVIDCLNTLIHSGYELYLLTYGDNDYQRLKINAANITNFFKKIIITEKDKSKLDIDYENSIFIDNNPIEIEKFSNSNAKKLIRIRRDNDKFVNIKCNVSNIVECDNFYHIIKLLKGGFFNE